MALQDRLAEVLETNGGPAVSQVFIYTHMYKYLHVCIYVLYIHTYNISEHSYDLYKYKSIYIKIYISIFSYILKYSLTHFPCFHMYISYENVYGL